jgi:hypothetical protein
VKGLKTVTEEKMVTRTVDDISREIRDLANTSLFIENIKPHGFNWDLTWAAMDMIEDAQLAIQSYQEGGISSDQGMEYLKVYGLFQAIFMQQDATGNLAEGLALPIPSIASDVEAGDVREIRNKYFGHHKYKRKGKTTYHGISRMSVGGGSITAWTWPNFSTEEVNLKNAIAVNEKYIKHELESILNGMKEKAKSFKSKLPNPLSEDNQSYHFGKIYSWIYGNNRDKSVMAEASVASVNAALDELESGFKERYENFSGVGDLERVFGKARHALEAIEELLKANSNGMNGDFDAEIYIDSLNSSFGEIIDIAIETNSEFREQ